MRAESAVEGVGRCWQMHYRLRRGENLLVLLHGLGLSGDFFSGAATHSSLSQWGLLIPDLIGFGRSPAPETGFDFGMDSQAAAVWDLCNELGIAKCTVLGHSMGGVVAVCMALQRPDAVEHLIIAEGNLAPEPNVWSAEIAAAGEEGYASAWRELQTTLSWPSLRQTTLRSVVLSARSLQETPRRADYRAFVEHTQVPISCIRGEEPPAEVNSLALCAKLGIPVRTVPRSGHFFTTDNPDGFYKVVAEALQSSPSHGAISDRR